jgi:hypothetical protein
VREKGATVCSSLHSGFSPSTCMKRLSRVGICKHASRAPSVSYQFSGTIRENLRGPDSLATDATLLSTLSRVGLGAFLSRQPKVRIATRRGNGFYASYRRGRIATTMVVIVESLMLSLGLSPLALTHRRLREGRRDGLCLLSLRYVFCVVHIPPSSWLAIRASTRPSPSTGRT